MSFKASLVQWKSNGTEAEKIGAKQQNWEHYLIWEKIPLGRFWINIVQEKFVIVRVSPEKKSVISESEKMFYCCLNYISSMQSEEFIYISPFISSHLC